MLLPSISLQWLVKSFSSSARRTLKWSIPWGLMQKIRTWNRQNTLSCIYPSGYQEFWYRYIINTSILSVFCSTAVCVFKHEYLQSRAFICLSLSSPPSSLSGYLSIKSWTIEILVLTSWISASKNFCRRVRFKHETLSDYVLEFEPENSSYNRVSSGFIHV